MQSSCSFSLSLSGGFHPGHEIWTTVFGFHRSIGIFLWGYGVSLPFTPIWCYCWWATNVQYGANKNHYVCFIYFHVFFYVCCSKDSETLLKTSQLGVLIKTNYGLTWVHANWVFRTTDMGYVRMALTISAFTSFPAICFSMRMWDAHPLWNEPNTGILVLIPYCFKRVDYALIILPKPGSLPSKAFSGISYQTHCCTCGNRVVWTSVWTKDPISC